MSAQDNAALARELYARFNRHDIEGALTLATEDVEVTIVPFGQTYRGRQGFNDFMAGFATAFPDIALSVINQVAAEDQVVNEFTWTGTHTGPLMTPAGAVPPTGRRVESQVCEVWGIKDGKLASLRNYLDAAGLMRQLGLLPEPHAAGA